MEITLCYKMRKLHTAHTVNTVVNTIHNTVSDVVEIEVQCIDCAVESFKDTLRSKKDSLN